MCEWCGGTGHIEKTSFDKENGVAKGGRSAEAEGSTSKKVKEAEAKFGDLSMDSDDDPGYTKILIAEAGSQIGDKNVWVCDSGSDYHLTHDATMFNSWSPLENVPVDFKPLKTMKGDLTVEKFGEVELACPVEGTEFPFVNLTLSDVLFVPGLHVNILSFTKPGTQNGATTCSVAFRFRDSTSQFLIFTAIGLQLCVRIHTAV